MRENRDQYLNDVFSIVEPEDIKWVFVSHDDVDHTGNLNALMQAAPNATVIVNWFMWEQMGDTLEVPLNRQRWIGDGESFIAGDCTLYAVRPPVFDSPTTRGLFDAKTGFYWASDSFAAPMLDLVTNVDQIDPGFWHDGMAMFHQYVRPWYELLDDAEFQKTVNRIESLGITNIAGCHTPHIGPSHVAQALRQIRTFAQVTVPAEPGQDVLDQMLGATPLAAGDRLGRDLPGGEGAGSVVDPAPSSSPSAGSVGRSAAGGARRTTRRPPWRRDARAAAWTCTSAPHSASAIGNHEVAVDLPLHHGHRSRRHVGGELVDVRPHLVEQLLVGHEPIDEADAERFLGAEAARAPHQVERAVETDDARQQPARAVLGDEAAPRERGREAGARCREPQVAHHRQHEPAAGGHAVDRGDDRLRHPQDVAEQRRELIGVRVAAARAAGSPEAERARSPVSSPALNARPLPVTTIAMTFGSDAAASITDRISSTISNVNAFSFSGRSSRTIPIGPSTS